MKRGVVYAGMAGGVWGGVILAPSLLPEFNPVLISCARFALYGLVSLLVALPMAPRLLRQLSRRDALTLVKLSLVGNLINFALLATAVQLAGVATASLINGVLPVTITLLGRNERDAVPLSRLAWPLLLVAAGIVCINLEAFVASTSDALLARRMLGIACALCALACWTWFATHNARHLKQSHFDSHEWSTLSGIITGVFAVLAGLVIWIALPGVVPTGITPSRWLSFTWVCLFMAVLGSWLANALWNASTRRLPLTLSGQLIVFETLFALGYGYLAVQRLPTALEAIAIALLVGGVLWAVRQHVPAANTTLPD